MTAHLVLVHTADALNQFAGEAKLAATLNAEPSFREGGYVAFAGDPKGVAIERSGHFRGMWNCDGDAYLWTPAGYAEPAHTAGGVAEAVSHTLHAIGCV